jgi:NAD(P)-dependent dehydrogenase (short-subunit alcohol dehydrogenase family)
MKGQAYGRITNISAMVGFSPAPGRAPYAVSKAGVSLLTEIVAQEVKGSGITVNAIAPSIIATQANIESMPGEDSSKWVTPDQIADLACYLCSSAAGSITGTTVKAYGGV